MGGSRVWKPYVIVSVLALVAISFHAISASGSETLEIMDASGTHIPSKTPVDFVEEGPEKIDPAILDEQGVVGVIVKLEDNTTEDPEDIIEVKDDFGLGNYYYAEMPVSEIEKLEDEDSVEKVELDKEYQLSLDASVPLIGAGSFWNSSLDGSNVRICVIDSGVDSTHVSLSPRVVAHKDFTSEGSAGDTNGHGTHVAGIIASSNSTYKGVAPNSLILSAKVCGSSGSCSTSNIMSGIDWCIEQGADILSLSLGGPGIPSDTLSAYVDRVVDQGKIVVIAAGNSGSKVSSIECPGCAHKVITVGSTQTSKSSTIFTDLISSFSSRGPTSDGRIKPDVTAPGQSIVSANRLGGWTTKSGTSMSTPHVSGLAALVLQTRPSITPEEFKALIMNTPVDLGTSKKDNTYGAGRINISRVFDEINITFRGSLANSSSDFYKIPITNKSKEIRITLYWPENYSIHNDLDFYILDPSGSVVGYSDSSHNTDEIVRLNLTSSSPTGNWKIMVKPYNVFGTQPYAVASNIAPTTKYFLSASDVKIASYHKINVTSSGDLDVELDWNKNSDDLDLYLYDEDENLVGQSLSSKTNYENITMEVAPGILTAEVVFVSGTSDTIKYSVSSNSEVSQQTENSGEVKITKMFLKPLKPDSFEISWNTNMRSKGIVEYGTTKGYGSTVSGNYTKSHKMTLSNLKMSTTYSVRINATDLRNSTSTLDTLNFTTGSATKFTSAPNLPTNLNFTQQKTTLDIVTNDTVNNAAVNLTLLRTNPVSANLSSPIDMYLSVDPSENLVNSFSFAILKVYYSDEDIAGVNESNLRLFLFNGSGWNSFDPPIGGVNESGNYVWANRTGFSTYAVGEKQEPVITMSSNPSWSASEGTATAVSCSPNDSEIEVRLYRDGAEVSNPDSQTLSTGTYAYNCNSTETSNYVSSSVSNTVTISQAPSPAVSSGSGGGGGGGGGSSSRNVKSSSVQTPEKTSSPEIPPSEEEQYTEEPVYHILNDSVEIKSESIGSGGIPVTGFFLFAPAFDQVVVMTSLVSALVAGGILCWKRFKEKSKLSLKMKRMKRRMRLKN